MAGDEPGDLCKLTAFLSVQLRKQRSPTRAQVGYESWTIKVIPEEVMLRLMSPLYGKSASCRL